MDEPLDEYDVEFAMFLVSKIPLTEQEIEGYVKIANDPTFTDYYTKTYQDEK